MLRRTSSQASSGNRVLRKYRLNDMRFRDLLGWGLLLLAGVALPSRFAVAQQSAQPPASEEQPAVPVPVVTGAPNADLPGADSTNRDLDQTSTRMLTPPPASGGSYPISVSAEERANYLRGGVTFNTAYSDNVLAGISGAPKSSLSYSIWPTVALDETSSRMHWVLSYAPGFTFYQKVSAYNESDENLGLEFTYRLSPHVTFSARDGLQKSSNVFNAPNLGAAGVVSGGTTVANQSVIAPVADRLSNTGNVGITYQFGANSMVGAEGSFANLHYPDLAQVPGLFDSESQAGSAFYAVRVSRMNYLGAIYQYQRLQSYPGTETNQTQTHAALGFYTLYLNPRFSISAFGGAQYADSDAQFSAAGSVAAPSVHSWNPDAGGSVSWQGLHTSAAISYSHMISGGGGLLGAVKMDGASASLRQQLSHTLSATAVAGYAQNDLLANAAALSGNGHSVSGTASVQQLVGQHLSLQLGYSRLHQDYSSVAVLAANPDTNREFVSISYQFSRPLGR